jgi:pheromone shutdown protein TraB
MMRNVCLFRRLWETAETANGARVVGVVGAAHVPGIRNMWPEAGTPQFEHLYEAYMTVPQQPRLGMSATLPTIATGALRSFHMREILKI